MTTDFEERAATCHEQLPGLLKARLEDFGVYPEVTDQYQIGWEDEHFTVPIRGCDNRVAYFERWDPLRIGAPVDPVDSIELFPWSRAVRAPERLVLAEGVYEALIFESQGIPAVSATGSGRFFKCREWGPPMGAMPEVVVAYRRGEKRERQAHLLSRDVLRRHVLDCLNNAKLLEWPEEVGPGGGAYAYFVKNKHTVAEFEALLSAE
jgi:hypothetical protein